MINVEKSMKQPASPHYLAPDGKMDPLLGRLDLLAILTVVLGACLLTLAATVMAVIGMARLILLLWADPFNRWLLVGLGVAVAWLLLRRKRLCVF